MYSTENANQLPDTDGGHSDHDSDKRPGREADEPVKRGKAGGFHDEHGGIGLFGEERNSLAQGGTDQQEGPKR